MRSTLFHDSSYRIGFQDAKDTYGRKALNANR